MFRESLPDSCPPPSAIELADRRLVRLVETATPSASDFDSHAAKGKAAPAGVDPCRWASCSTICETKAGVEVKEMIKLPGLRHMRFAAYIKVDESSGKVVFDKRSVHADFWMYSSFDPMTAITRVDPIP